MGELVSKLSKVSWVSGASLTVLFPPVIPGLTRNPCLNVGNKLDASNLGQMLRHGSRIGVRDDGGAELASAV